MKALAMLFGLTRPKSSDCLEHIRAERLAEVRALLAEIAEQPCPCPR